MLNHLPRQTQTSRLLAMGFSVIFLMLLAISWLALTTMQAYNDRMLTLIDSVTIKSAAAVQMRELVIRRTAAYRSLPAISDNDNYQQVIDSIHQLTRDYVAQRHQLQRLVSDVREIEILEVIRNAENASLEMQTRVSAYTDNNANLENQLETLHKVALSRDEVLRSQLNRLIEVEQAVADEQLMQNLDDYQRTRRFLLFMALTALVIGGLTITIVGKRIRAINRRVVHLATHDDLTGLINRREFKSQLQYLLQTASSSRKVWGLMYLDLDRFKIVNDTCGHHAGDRLLIELTSMIRARLRKEDRFARIGGDEFALIASAIDFDSIIQLAEQLRDLVEKYVFNYANQQFSVSLSIGLTPVRGDIQDLEQILATVDSACYVAKQSGRNRVHVARAGDADMIKYQSDLAGIQLIRKALSDQNLNMFYQPVYGIRDNDFVLEHCELLLRIRTDDDKLHAPGEFLPVAEKYNIIHEIDRWVLHYILDWMTTYQNQYQLPKLMINLSGLSFIDEKFVLHLIGELMNTEADIHQIAFEITETAAVDNLETAAHFMQQIKALGCKFALDDFGSGFSTFTYLKKLPIDYLKIDGSLVRNITRDSVDREMVRAINEIGHTVGARTIAEYVEDEHTLDLLRELNVDLAQGFGLQKPKPIDELLKELAPWQHPQTRFKAS